MKNFLKSFRSKICYNLLMVYLIYSLPTELNDDLLITIGTVDLAIFFKRYWAASKIYTTPPTSTSQDTFMNIIRYLSVEKKNILLTYAATNGYTQVTKLLLLDPQVDPSTIDIYSIWVNSLGWDVIDTIELLLSDPRVDPSLHNNFLIVLAAEHGKVDLVKLLLLDPRVDPAADFNTAIR